VCGIAGEVRFAGAVDRAGLEARSACIAHRGPDADRTWVSHDGRVGFAFRRLSIVDLTTGDQPLANEDGSIVSMFNGEIYNHRELRQELESLGHRFATDHADSEVIPHGYEAWGDGVIDRLRGMFAIALWDLRRERLLLARDRLGEKPLYVRHLGDRVAFASEIAAVEEPGDAVDLAALNAFLTYQYIPAPRTILKGVTKLQAGEIATFEAGADARRRYWTVHDRPSREPATDGEVKALIDEAVRIRCEADVPIGAFLSGGVDSSVVTAILARASTQPVHTFSIGFPVPRLDETEAARLVARELGTIHHAIGLDELDPGDVERAVAHAGEPLADAAAIPTYLLSAVAREHVKVVLTGEGADELFGGYAHYRNQHRLRVLLEAPSTVRHLGAVGLRAVGPHLGPRVPERLADLLDVDPAVQPREWRAVMPRRRRSALFPVEDPEPTSDAIIAAAARGRHLGIEGSFATDLAVWVPEDLMVKVDRMTMAHGLEARPPFLDHVLVEATMSLPIERRWRPDRDKALLREFAASILPAQTASKPKQTFTTPTDAWLRGPLAASSAAATQALLDWGIDRSALHELQTHSLGGGRDRGQWGWVMYVLGRWLIDHPGIAERRLAA
jgi:asparagine synthase (glutamine-hydrolysing)